MCKKKKCIFAFFLFLFCFFNSFSPKYMCVILEMWYVKCCQIKLFLCLLRSLRLSFCMSIFFLFSTQTLDLYYYFCCKSEIQMKRNNIKLTALIYTNDDIIPFVCFCFTIIDEFPSSKQKTEKTKNGFLKMYH